jgi:hypothetical protein
MAALFGAVYFTSPCTPEGFIAKNVYSTKTFHFALSSNAAGIWSIEAVGGYVVQSHASVVQTINS